MFRTYYLVYSPIQKVSLKALNNRPRFSVFNLVKKILEKYLYVCISFSLIHNIITHLEIHIIQQLSKHFRLPP